GGGAGVQGTRREKNIALVDMDIRSREGLVGDPELAARVERVDCYALAQTDLSGYLGLVVPAMVDQEYLAGHAEVIARYLDGGGVVVFGGHLHRPWLPGTSPFAPLEVRSFRSYQVAAVADHPVFAGVDPADLTFRRGVAGFFARGHHPLPDHPVEVLTRLAGGEPATYVDRHASAGTVLVHASCDLLGYHGLEGSTAARIPSQLLDWVAAEGRRRRQERPVGRRPGPPVRGARTPVTGAGASPAGGRAGGGLAAVYGGSAQHHRTLTAPKYARHLTGGFIYLPDLAGADLRGLDGLVIPERLHRRLLTEAAPRVCDLLDAGGTVAAFAGGEPLPEFLPGVRFEPRPTNYWWWLEPGADLGLRTPSPGHSLFEHLELADCTWHYHGVLDPPAGAEVLVTLPGGEALLYVDRVSTAGTLVVSTLDPISHYGSYFMPATERFLDGFWPWLSASLTGERAGRRP
ncbi:MAG: hypothetical protein ACRDY7_03105, partial [Acidimicrobiia bacterium]